MAEFRAFIDTFESPLSKKDHANSDVVLHEIRVGGGRFSTFEMTQTLMNTLNRLEKEGKIKDTKGSYPWHTYEAINDESDEASNA